MKTVLQEEVAVQVISSVSIISSIWITWHQSFIIRCKKARWDGGGEGVGQGTIATVHPKQPSVAMSVISFKGADTKL